MKHLPLFALIVVAPTLATAEPADQLSLGARIGGYGFKRDQISGSRMWDECRMGGIGVFGQRGLGRGLFVETGLDLYVSDEAPATDLPIDRMSGLATIAGGARMSRARFSGHVQVGVGLEATRVSVPYGEVRITDSMFLPLAFVGFGGDVALTSSTRFGATVRLHSMGNFSYDPNKLKMESGWSSPPSADTVFEPSADVSAQGQFYIAHDL